MEINYDNLISYIEIFKINYTENNELVKQFIDLYNLIKMYETKHEELNMVEKEILITIIDTIIDIYKSNYKTNKDFKDNLFKLIKCFFETINYPKLIEDNIYDEIK